MIKSVLLAANILLGLIIRCESFNCVSQLNTCSCKTDVNGWVLDLKPLDSQSPDMGKFFVHSLHFPGTQYHYNPCIPIRCGQVEDTAVCRESELTGSLRVGQQRPAYFVGTRDSRTVLLVYPFINHNLTGNSTVELYCNASEKVGTLLLLNESLTEAFPSRYYFRLVTKHACPPPVQPNSSLSVLLVFSLGFGLPTLLGLTVTLVIVRPCCSSNRASVNPASDEDDDEEGQTRSPEVHVADASDYLRSMGRARRERNRNPETVDDIELGRPRGQEAALGTSSSNSRSGSGIGAVIPPSYESVLRMKHAEENTRGRARDRTEARSIFRSRRVRSGSAVTENDSNGNRQRATGSSNGLRSTRQTTRVRSSSFNESNNRTGTLVPDTLGRITNQSTRLVINRSINYRNQIREHSRNRTERCNNFSGFHGRGRSLSDSN